MLDLLESLARRLPNLDVSSQQRLAEMKYKLLSTKVDPNNKKQVYELCCQALESGMCVLFIYLLTYLPTYLLTY